MGVLGAFTVKLFDLFSALLSDRNSKNDNKAPSKRRLTLESLENRELLSAAPLEIYGPPTYETWASARSETASSPVVVSIRDVKYETAPLDLSNLSENADSPLVMEPVSEKVYEDAASLLKGCVQETGEAAQFDGAREPQIKEITFDSQNVSDHTADSYFSDGLPPLLTMNGSGGSGGSGSGGGDDGSGGGTGTSGGYVNLGLNVTEPDTNSLYSYGDGYALRENRGADDVSFEPNVTFDYIEFTVESLPMGYEASLHFSGSASYGNDYVIYSHGPYDVSYHSVTLTNGALTLYGSSGGATTHYYITPCNNFGVQAVDKELTVSLQNVHKSSSGGSTYEFNMGTTSFSVTLVDDDKWNVDVDASDPVASERLPGVAPDYGYYTFTRTAGVEGVPCDASYGLTVYFDVLVAPSDPYYCAARNVDYLLNANQLNENDSNVYLSNFQYRGWYDTEMTDEGTTEYRFHYQGTIPAYENSALLRLVPIFDWEDEGDVYELVGDPGEQTGEKVKITVTSTSLPVGSSGWDPIASSTPADVEIKDGFIFTTYFDGNNDGELDPVPYNTDRMYVPFNNDNDDGNDKLDYLDGSGGSSEDDLRKLRILTWAGDNVTREDGSVYSFDIYVEFPVGSNVSTWQEGEKLQRYDLDMTSPFYSLASGCSQNDIMYTEGCSGGSVYPQFQLRTTLTASGVPSEVPSLTLTRTPEFYVTEYFVDLDVDSDNNGYINTSANPTREKAEDGMEASVGKRITYFSDETGVPDDYMYVPVRVKNIRAPSFPLQGGRVYYSFECSANLELYKWSSSGGTGVPFNQGFLTPVGSSREVLSTATDLNSISNLNTGIHDIFYVKAVGSAPSGTVSLKLWEYDTNSSQYTEVARDTVLFSVQNDGYAPEWIVPSGWTINPDGSLVTPTPHAGAIGPQTEGSGVKTNDGDVISRYSYENGFNIKFDFSFERNTSDGCPTGYIYPESYAPAHNEVITPPPSNPESNTAYDPRKIGFFGNSGIKIFNVPLEIQIFDTDALLDMLNIDTVAIGSDDLNRVIQSLSMFLNEDKTEMTVPGYQEYVNDNLIDQVEILGHLVSGEDYRDTNVSVYGLINARNRQRDSNSMEIDLSKRDVAGDCKYYLNVMINDYRIITNRNVTSKLESSNNKIIRIQSHWGSGVRFNNIRVSSPNVVE